MINQELAKAQIAYEQNPQKAIEQAINGVSPENIVPLAFMKYVTYRATIEGNIEAQRQLVQKTASTATEYGQNIAMLRGRILSEDPNAFLEQLLKQKRGLLLRNFAPAWEELGKKFGKKGTSVDEIVKRIKKQNKKGLSEALLKAKEIEMESFFEAIKC